MTSFGVVSTSLKNPPQCPHGPTVLFSRLNNNEKRNFYACAAYRDKKHCSFFLWEDEIQSINNGKKKGKNAEKNIMWNINHRKLFIKLNKIINLPPSQRAYCNTCAELITQSELEHESHKLIKNLSDHQISHPTEILPPLEDSKKEAQYLFNKSSVDVLVKILKTLNYKNIICMGTPKIHDHISNHETDLNSLLLDIDSRFHCFYGPLQFCCYNMFNHHFFFSEAREVFSDFLESSRSDEIAIILDPPFGGRVELIAETLKKINEQYNATKENKVNIPVFLIFPYFMEPQIKNHLPDYVMLDYKVDYENHPLFKNGSKGRKFGSPVRIFTNVDPSCIPLPEDEGYRYCKLCKKWVAQENRHCKICKSCTSKDGRTYIHCSLCQRCVKPSWKHCEKCKRCAQIDHKCEELPFIKECFHCKQPGHKKRDCPSVNHKELKRKRKLGLKSKVKKSKIQKIK